MNSKLILACVPLVLLLAFIAVVVSIFGNETLAGASQISLIVATAVCLGIGLLRRDTTWADFEKTLSEKMGSVSGAVIILLLIGALGGSWMVGGQNPLPANARFLRRDANHHKATSNNRVFFII